jgi:hypothetical protein
VTKNDTLDYYPDYLPNCKKIAYVAQETEDADLIIRTIKTTGGSSFQVTTNNMEGYEPSYTSPCFTRIGLSSKQATLTPPRPPIIPTLLTL